MDKLRCKICGHRWIPRSENPRLCPKCKSPRWNDETISTKFIREKVQEEVLQLLEDGSMFGRQISRKLNYAYPIISFVLLGMGRNERIVSNLEISITPTKKRRGRISRKYVLREMQMKSPILNLKKCNDCGGYGITRTIIGSYYWANECLLCGIISDKTFDEQLKEDHDKLAKRLKEMTEKIEKEGFEAVFGDVFKKFKKDTDHS